LSRQVNSARSKLLPRRTAQTTLLQDREQPLVIDGAIRETRRPTARFLTLVDWRPVGSNIEYRKGSPANPGGPTRFSAPRRSILSPPGKSRGVTDAGWISSILTAARPHAVRRFCRNFRDLDLG